MPQYPTISMDDEISKAVCDGAADIHFAVAMMGDDLAGLDAKSDAITLESFVHAGVPMNADRVTPKQLREVLLYNLRWAVAELERQQKEHT